MKTQWVKKMFQVQWSLKKVMLTVFWDMKTSMTIDFLEKGKTLNSVSYCQVVRKYFAYLLNDPHILLFHTYQWLIDNIFGLFSEQFPSICSSSVMFASSNRTVQKKKIKSLIWSCYTNHVHHYPISQCKEGQSSLRP